LNPTSPEPKKLTIVCLGDSLTGPSPGAAYLDKYLKWSDLLGLSLEASLGMGRVRVHNSGRAGDTSSGVRQDLEERLLRFRPDIAILLIGANNFSPDRSRGMAPSLISGELKADLKEIVSRASAAQIRVLLLQYAEPKAENREKVWTHADAGNPVIEEVALAENVPVLNLGPAFHRAAETQPLASLASPVDGIHLNPGGELVLARAVAEKLRALGWVLG